MDKQQIDIELTIDWQEELKSHLDYLDQVYAFCLQIRDYLNDKTHNQISKQLQCQMMILTSISNFLKSIRLLSINGYTAQAAVLGSSIFELSHVSAYFLYTPEAVDKWLECKDIQATMPNLIGIEDYTEIVKQNYSYKGLTEHSDNEYKIYKQLSWMKNFSLINGNLQLHGGTNAGEKYIHLAWFIIEHSGRLAELTAGNLIGLQDDEFIEIRLNGFANIRAELNKMTLARFENNAPIMP